MLVTGQAAASPFKAAGAAHPTGFTVSFTGTHAVDGHTYYSFRVTGDGRDNSVSKRYSEFVTLDSALRASRQVVISDADTNLPRLSASRGVGSAEDRLLVRQEELRLYLQNALQHPLVGISWELAAFLGLRKDTSGGGDSDGASSTGTPAGSVSAAITWLSTTKLAGNDVYQFDVKIGDDGDLRTHIRLSKRYSEVVALSDTLLPYRRDPSIAKRLPQLSLDSAGFGQQAKLEAIEARKAVLSQFLQVSLSSRVLLSDTAVRQFLHTDSIVHSGVAPEFACRVCGSRSDAEGNTVYDVQVMPRHLGQVIEVTRPPTAKLGAGEVLQVSVSGKTYSCTIPAQVPVGASFRIIVPTPGSEMQCWQVEFRYSYLLKTDGEHMKRFRELQALQHPLDRSSTVFKSSEKIAMERHCAIQGYLDEVAMEENFRRSSDLWNLLQLHRLGGCNALGAVSSSPSALETGGLLGDVSSPPQKVGGGHQQPWIPDAGRMAKFLQHRALGGVPLPAILARPTIAIDLEKRDLEEHGSAFDMFAALSRADFLTDGDDADAGLPPWVSDSNLVRRMSFHHVGGDNSGSSNGNDNGGGAGGDRLFQKDHLSRTLFQEDDSSSGSGSSTGSVSDIELHVEVPGHPGGPDWERIAVFSYSNDVDSCSGLSKSCLACGDWQLLPGSPHDPAGSIRMLLQAKPATDATAYTVDVIIHPRGLYERVGQPEAAVAGEFFADSSNHPTPLVHRPWKVRQLCDKEGRAPPPPAPGAAPASVQHLLPYELLLDGTYEELLLQWRPFLEVKTGWPAERPILVSPAPVMPVSLALP